MKRGRIMPVAMNIVRFKPKPGQKDTVIKAHAEFDISAWPGCISIRMVDTGDGLCVLCEWESTEHMQQAMPLMIALLDSFRDCLDEISSQLGVTDPISGAVVVDNK